MTDNAVVDDCIQPFQVESSGARGRLVRLGPAITHILGQHAYPEPVSKLLGEAIVLAAMLGASLKIDGRFILQASSEGVVRFVVAQFQTPGNLRGYASFDKDAFAGQHLPDAPLLRDGHLVMTIDQGADTERYQGIVALAGASLTSAADLYFAQSEQIPTFIRVAVALQYEAGKDGASGSWSWRAGGLMVQKLPDENAPPSHDAADADADEAWSRVRLFASTVEDHELLDPALPPERLLYRLFHEERVRAFAPTPLAAFCQCSPERVEGMLATMAPAELDALAHDARIQVTCEFCNRLYEFDAPSRRVP